MERADRSVIAMLIIAITIIVTISPIVLQQIYASGNVGPIKTRKAPIANSGDNVYITWWSNKTGYKEVMFKASTDIGETFGDKLNLCNSNKGDLSLSKALVNVKFYIEMAKTEHI